MNFNSITTIINISIALFLMTGLIWGMTRGALKSFVRLSFLIFNCIFWVMITPEISRFILNTNLYPLINITVGEQTFTTIADVTNHFIQTTPAILEFMASSPIIATFVEQMPNIVANFVVFITGYFLLKSITLPIYAFVMNRIIKLIQMKSTKQIDPQKKKLRSRLLGALFGLMQSALTGMILFLPISTLSIVLNGAENSSMFLPNTLSTSQTVEADNNNPTTPTQNFNISKQSEFLNIYYNTMLSNTLNAMNLNGLNEFLFNELTTIYVNDVKISLAEELKNANKIMQQTTTLLKDNGISNLSDATTADFLKLIATMNYDDAEHILNNLFELKSLRLIGNDVLNYIYKNVSTDDKTIEQHLTELSDSISPIVNNLMLSLKTGNVRLLKDDVLNLFNFVETLQNNGIFDSFKNTTIANNLELALKNNDSTLLKQTALQILNSIMQKLEPLNELQIKNQLIAPLFQSSTVRRLTPDLLNLTIDALNQALNLNIEKVNRVSVAWFNETTKISKLTYLLKELAKDINLEANVDILNIIQQQNVSLETVGSLLNIMRESQLFSHLYYNTITQLFEKYFILVEEQGTPLQFEFISLQNTNWQAEFKSLDYLLQTANELFLTNNFESLDANKMTLLIQKTFNSPLIKEILLKSKNILPNILLGYLDNVSPLENAQSVLTTIKISLQEMSFEQIYDDLIIFTDMLNTVLSKNETGLVNKLLSLDELQVKTLLTQFNTSYIGTKLFPQTINLIIAKGNDAFNLNMDYLEQIVTLNENDITLLSQAISNLLTVYNEYVLLDNEQKQNEIYSIKTLIQELDIQKVGTAINQLKNIPTFNNMYEEILLKVLLNKDFLNEVLNTDLFSYLELTPYEVANINWELEVNMAKQAAIMGIDASNIEELGYDSIRVDLFLQNYGESKLLKLGLINVILSLYPDTNINSMLNLNLTESAASIGGIAEAVFLFLDFKYNGPPKIELIEKYRIREGLKQIDANTSLSEFLKELTKIETMKYSELASLVDTLVLLLEGKEFSLKTFSKYLDATPFIPWVVGLIEKISQGYKMPYSLNIYMQVDLFNTRIKLYGIHLGKQTATDEKGTTEPMDTQTVIDLMNQLSLVPNFIAAQFVYDPTFVQPAK